MQRSRPGRPPRPTQRTRSEPAAAPQESPRSASALRCSSGPQLERAVESRSTPARSLLRPRKFRCKVAAVQVDAYIDGVISKCDSLKRNGFWAPEPQVRPKAWLENFPEGDERALAAILLDNLVFLGDRAVERLLVAAYNELEDQILLNTLPTNLPGSVFMQRVKFTPVEGEAPRPTDSGKSFCRKLRDAVELPDDRFVDPTIALQQAILANPIVFIDDYLGSGQQLIKTWHRHYAASSPRSFAEAYAQNQFSAVCLVPVATETSLLAIQTHASGLQVIATHVLDASYSAKLLEAPVLVPPVADLQADLRSLLARHAPLLDLPPFLTGDQAIYGFAELALLLAFGHGVPDSTLPVVWAPGPGDWIKLVKQ